MRSIEVEDGLRIRFPQRSPEFDEGFEIGLAAALMTIGTRAFSRSVSTASVDQLQAVSEKLGYHVQVERTEGDRSTVSVRLGRPRPKLTIVHSRTETGQRSASLEPLQYPRPAIKAAAGAPERTDRLQLNQIS